MLEGAVSIRRADPAYNHSISRDNLRPSGHPSVVEREIALQTRSACSRHRKLYCMPGIVYEFRLTTVDLYVALAVFRRIRTQSALGGRCVLCEIRKLLSTGNYQSSALFRIECKLSVISLWYSEWPNYRHWLNKSMRCVCHFVCYHFPSFHSFSST